MPYVSHNSHTRPEHIHIYTTHYATILTRSVCPSHVTVLLEAATACLLAFSAFRFRPRVSNESFRCAPSSNIFVLEIHSVFYRTYARKRIRVERKPLDENSILPFPHIVQSSLYLSSLLYCSM